MKPIFTLEDGTEVLETTGDAEALQYGGGVLYRAPGNVVVWDFWEAPEKNFFVYTADATKGVLEHYNVNLDELFLASGGEINKKELMKLSVSPDPRARLQVLILIKESYGASHLDPLGPLELTKFDLACKWGALFGVQKESVEQIALNDYMIIEKNDYWECGRIDGTFLGRFKRYEYALASIADDMKITENNANLFHEHSPGQIELVQWDWENHTGRLPEIRRKMPMAQWKIAMRRYNMGHKPHSKRKRLASRIRRSEAMRIEQKNRLERARRIRDYLSG